MKNNNIQDAFRAILGVCDGAQTRDDWGFNAADAAPARRLARHFDVWDEYEDYAAWAMLRKYAGQLRERGIDYDSLPTPPKPALPDCGRVVSREGTSNILRFGFDWGERQFDAIKSRVKTLALPNGQGWDASAKRWRVPFTAQSREAVLELIDSYDFRLSAGAMDLLGSPPPKPVRTVKAVGSQWLIAWRKGDPAFDALLGAVKALPKRRYDADSFGWLAPASEDLLAICERYEVAGREALAAALAAKVEQQAANLAASRAADADFNVAGLGGTLRPFQKAGVAYALANKRVFIADEMGLGKTVQALATLHAAQAFPALIVCPASLKLNWKREAEKWLPGRSVSVWNGQAGSANADIVVINYDVLKKHAPALAEIKFQAVVFDESHYLKNHAAQRTEAAKALARGAPYRLCLTGTPVLNRPQELLSQLGLLGRLDDLGGFWHFAKRYCNAQQSRFGWDFSGAANLPELNEKLRANCFVRRAKADVLTELPAKQRADIALPLDNRREYERAERELIAWLRDQATSDKAFLASITSLSAEERERAKAERANNAEQRARRAEQLVRIEALKQLAAQGQLAAVTDWARSFVESGEKLVLFASHIEIQKALIAAFPGCASVLGEYDTATRQANVDRFQSDPACQIAICSLAAAAEGITLTAASNVAFCELGWNPAKMAQAEDRVHRIGQANAVTAWYLLAEGTIYQEINALIAAKRAVVDAATEGDAVQQAEDGILKSLIAKLISASA